MIINVTCQKSRNKSIIKEKIFKTPLAFQLSTEMNVKIILARVSHHSKDPHFL
jgi:hypothetical protein